MRAIIGYTGFVGGNLLHQTTFDLCFNSSNISDLRNHEYDLLVVAAPSAVKWMANKEPDVYMAMVDALLKDLEGVKCKRVVYLSTVDVYAVPNSVDENTPIDCEVLHPYGRQRHKIEEYVQKNYPDHLIVRLPGLFGKNLKKNFVYDLLHDNALDFTHKDSIFQWYDLSNLWKDVTIAIKNNIRLINFATEPLDAQELALRVFGMEFNNVTDKSPVAYDVKSIHSKIYGQGSGYLYTKEQCIAQLTRFVQTYKKVF